jgi:hypothetical protein
VIDGKNGEIRRLESKVLEHQTKEVFDQSDSDLNLDSAADLSDLVNDENSFFM